MADPVEIVASKLCLDTEDGCIDWGSRPCSANREFAVELLTALDRAGWRIVRPDCVDINVTYASPFGPPRQRRSITVAEEWTPDA